MGSWPPARSMMLRRRWPRLTAGCSNEPASSGPRCASAAAMRPRSCRSGAPAKPKMPHMGHVSWGVGCGRRGAARPPAASPRRPTLPQARRRARDGARRSVAPAGAASLDCGGRPARRRFPSPAGGQSCDDEPAKEDLHVHRGAREVVGRRVERRGQRARRGRRGGAVLRRQPSHLAAHALQGQGRGAVPRGARRLAHPLRGHPHHLPHQPGHHQRGLLREVRDQPRGRRGGRRAARRRRHRDPRGFASGRRLRRRPRTRARGAGPRPGAGRRLAGARAAGKHRRGRRHHGRGFRAARPP